MAVAGKTGGDKVYDPACGFRVIIMAEVNSYSKSKFSVSLPKNELSRFYNHRTR